MARRQHKVNTNVDTFGVIAAFVFGLLIGATIAYPVMPGLSSLGTVQFRSSPIATPLLLGVALFALFFVGVFVLNWLFMEAD